MGNGEAREQGRHPFGALVADRDGAIVVERGNNSVPPEGDPTQHAELAAAAAAFRALGPERMAATTLYTSAEPCAMCTGAVYWTGIGRIVYALSESRLLVPIAQALVALPLVVRTLQPVLSGIDDRQRQAAATLGAGPLRVLRTVDLPVRWRPLLAAAGFAFATSLGEFGATSFLARPDRPTVPVVIARLLGHPGAMNFGMALAAAVVLAATTAIVMVVVDLLRVPSVGAI